MIYALIALLIPLGSYLHGRDLVSKGIILGAQAALFAVAGFYTLGWWGISVALIVPYFWFLIRTGTNYMGTKLKGEAGASIDYIDNKPYASLDDIALAFAIPTAITAALIIGVSIYFSSWLTFFWLLPLAVSHGLCVMVASWVGQIDYHRQKKLRAKKRMLTEIFGVGIYGATTGAIIYSLIMLI